LRAKRILVARRLGRLERHLFIWGQQIAFWH
jgi:hypothetical protein